MKWVLPVLLILLACGTAGQDSLIISGPNDTLMSANTDLGLVWMLEDDLVDGLTVTVNGEEYKSFIRGADEVIVVIGRDTEINESGQYEITLKVFSDQTTEEDTVFVTIYDVFTTTTVTDPVSPFWILGMVLLPVGRKLL